MRILAFAVLLASADPASAEDRDQVLGVGTAVEALGDLAPWSDAPSKPEPDPSEWSVTRKIFGAEIEELVTDSKSWGGYGWSELRWGMGPMDALGALRDTAIIRNVKGTPNVEQEVYFLTNDTVFGEKLAVRAEFKSGMLRIIHLVPMVNDTTNSAAWRKLAREGLIAKYGKPDLRDGAGLGWQSDRKTLVYWNPTESMITYVDAGWARAQKTAEERAKRAEAEKL